MKKVFFTTMHESRGEWPFAPTAPYSLLSSQEGIKLFDSKHLAPTHLYKMTSKNYMAEPEEQYQAFVTTLQETEGFRLLFVRCSQVTGEELITSVQNDIPQAKIEVLRLSQPIDNLSVVVNSTLNQEQCKILLVIGLEKSFIEYIKLGNGGEGEYYQFETAPPLLEDLNQQVDKFRENFPLCLVFLLPLFGIKSVRHHALNWFNENSGVFEFVTAPEVVKEASHQLIAAGKDEPYNNLTLQQQTQKIIEIQELLVEKHQTTDNQVDLLVERGKLLAAAQEYEAAIANYDEVLKLKPDCHLAWNSRGDSLDNLGKYEEAIASYDQAVEIQSDDYLTWNNRGISLDNLGRYEEAIASYDQAIQIQPDKHQAWYNRGISLKDLGRYEQAISSFDQAIQIQPDKHQTWYHRGISLDNLGRYEEAIASYDQAVQIQPDDHQAWNNRGISLQDLGRYEQAIASFDQAIAIQPDYDLAWGRRGISLDKLGRHEEAIASFDQTVEIKPDDRIIWLFRGISLAQLGRYEDAIASFDQAIQLKPDHHLSWFCRGLSLNKLGRYEDAIVSFDQAIQLKPDDYEAWEKQGDSLLNLGRYEEAITSYDEALRLKPDYHKIRYNRSIAANTLLREKFIRFVTRFCQRLWRSLLKLLGLRR